MEKKNHHKDNNTNHLKNNNGEKVGIINNNEIAGKDALKKKYNKRKSDKHSVFESKPIRKISTIEKQRKMESEDFINGLDLSFKKSHERKRTNSIKRKEEKKDKKGKEEKITDGIRPRKLTYYDKYNKPKESFYSTSKNPKINEILKRLKENGTLKLPDDTIYNVGKIEPQKIVKYNKTTKKEKNHRDEHKKVVAPKIKAVIEKIKTKSDQPSAVLSSKAKIRRIKKIKKHQKSYDSEKEEESSEESEEDSEEESEEESSSSSSSSSSSKEKNKKNKKNYNTNKGKTPGGGLYYKGFTSSLYGHPDQAKYKNKKSSINYRKFSFSYYTITEQEFRERMKKKRKFILMPRSEIQISLLSEVEKSKMKIVRNKANVLTIVKDKKINKSQAVSDTKKKKSVFEVEKQSNDKKNYKQFEIKGYDSKPKRMSLIDILKKRQINIISEDKLKNNTCIDKKNNKNKKAHKDSNASPQKIRKSEGKIGIKKNSKDVNYIEFSFQKKKNKKWDPERFEKNNEANITLKGSIKLTNKEESLPKNIIGKKKVTSNYLVKNKTDNNNKAPSLVKSSLRTDKNENTVSFKEEKNKNKKTYSNKLLPTSNKNDSNNDNNRVIKPPILSRYSSSEEEEEEEEVEKKEKKKEEKTEQKVEIRKLNKYDELLFRSSDDSKKVKFSENSKKNKNEKNKNDDDIRKRSNSSLKNRVESENIYTDRETNEMRKSFKKKLTLNQYTNSNNNNDDEESVSSHVQKVKSKKVKIKQFKTKNNEYENELPHLNKKSAGHSKPQLEKAKIKKMSSGRSLHHDNENIPYENSTFNNTHTHNYYTKDFNKPNPHRTNTTYSSGRRIGTERNDNNKSKSVENRKKIKNKSVLRH